MGELLSAWDARLGAPPGPDHVSALVPASWWYPLSMPHMHWGTSWQGELVREEPIALRAASDWSPHRAVRQHLATRATHVGSVQFIDHLIESWGLSETIHRKCVVWFLHKLTFLLEVYPKIDNQRCWRKCVCEGLRVWILESGDLGLKLPRNHPTVGKFLHLLKKTSSRNCTSICSNSIQLIELS